MEGIQEAEEEKGRVGDHEKDVSNVPQNFENHFGSGEKILELQWNRESDKFKFSISKWAEMAEEELTLTKRSTLSTTSKLFDPLGIVGPVIVMAKLTFQDDCKLGLGWDSLPEHLAKRWVKWLKEMTAVTEIESDRCIYKYLEEETLAVFVHVFGDASRKGYCAALYLAFWYLQ